MKKTCLTCKYEPDWGDPTKGEYSRQYGRCKLIPELPPLPAVCHFQTESITRFVDDDSGVKTNCETWTAKS